MCHWGASDAVISRTAAKPSQAINTFERKIRRVARGEIRYVRKCSGMKLKERLSDLPWAHIQSSLNEYGWARTPPILSEEECQAIILSYSDPTAFRSRI